jgi:succinate-semialdehyde dehydrogenase / glutarate-semialdehyde dehydrogenase
MPTVAETVRETRRPRPPEHPGSHAPTRRLPEETIAALLRPVVTVGPREQLSVVSPLDERVLGHVPACTVEDVEVAVARARLAQQDWANRSLRARSAVLRRVARLVFARQDEVLDLIQLETGKVRSHAFEEVCDVGLAAAYYARTGASHLRPQPREGAIPLLTSTTELRHPKGVVGIISPWNYPLAMAVADALPALLAGNACVLKPARQTPFTALWAVQLLEVAGLPGDLVTVVTGRGSDLGDALVDAADAITFTGSTATGRLVARRAGERLVAASLELGGKNAMLVLDDADLDAAVEAAVRGCFTSAGQICVGIERLLVHAAVADDFLARLVARVEEVKLSAALGWGGDMGSLATREQFDTVERHVADAVAQGATVHAGGAPRPEVGPLVYAPTVLGDVTEGMAVAAEETFGPVVVVSTFDDEDEAVARANATPYGLSASIWTRDTRHGARLARQLHTGGVNVNEAYSAAYASFDAAMGGRKASGLGRRHGREGIWRYTELQTVATQRLVPFAGVLPGLSDERSAQVLTVGLQLLGRSPRMPSVVRRLARLPWPR